VAEYLIVFRTCALELCVLREPPSDQLPRQLVYRVISIDRYRDRGMGGRLCRSVSASGLVTDAANSRRRQPVSVSQWRRLRRCDVTQRGHSRSASVMMQRIARHSTR